MTLSTLFILAICLKCALLLYGALRPKPTKDDKIQNSKFKIQNFSSEDYPDVPDAQRAVWGDDAETMCKLQQLYGSSNGDWKP